MGRQDYFPDAATGLALIPPFFADKTPRTAEFRPVRPEVNLREISAKALEGWVSACKFTPLACAVWGSSGTLGEPLWGSFCGGLMEPR